MKQNTAAPGRPTAYTDELAEEILFQLMEGKSLNKICKQDGMPNASTIYRWLASKDYEDFALRYTKAREIQAEYHFDEIVDLSDEATNKDNALAIKVRVDARKWVASKLLPKKYGSFKAVEISGNMQQPLPDLSHLSFDQLYALKYGNQ